MKDEDKKILTEFLGECWYEKCTGVKAPWGTVYPSQDTSTDPNRTFNTWEDFGALWEKIDKKDLVISWIIQGEYERFILQSWRMWERAIPEKRCLIILEATKEGILAP